MANLVVRYWIQEIDNCFMIEGNDFPWIDYIKDKNIVRAANFILTLDTRSIQKVNQAYAHRWLDNLKKQFEFHYKRTRKEYGMLFNETTRRALIEQSSARLQQQTILVASILVPDIQQQLFDFLTEPNAPVPSIFNNEREW